MDGRQLRESKSIVVAAGVPARLASNGGTSDDGRRLARCGGLLDKDIRNDFGVADPMSVANREAEQAPTRSLHRCEALA